MDADAIFEVGTMMITVSMPQHTLMLGDCLERMKEIPDGSVDAVVCDLPYGTTRCVWDAVIPFGPLWDLYNRVCKPSAAIVLTASQPFTSVLVMSKPKLFRYSLVWDKVNKYTGALNVNRMPLRRHEDICVFYRRLPIYNKQWREGAPYHVTRTNGHGAHTEYGQGGPVRRGENGGRHNPCSVIAIPADNKRESGMHPCQKPVALMEYLIRTYTHEGETVLDNCFGSASTGVACINTGRKFIGVERDPHYFDVGRRRMEDAMRKAAQPAPQGGLFDSIAAE